MSVHVRIDRFEGPLDLLLYLVDKAQLSIRDIFVSDITGQYLNVVSDMDDGLENASEFAALAASIIEIKSRRLLPRIGEEESGDELGAEEMIIAQLEEYRRVKYEAAMLRAVESARRLSIARHRDEGELAEVKVELEGLSLDALKAALAQVLVRYGQTATPAQPGRIEREAYTVRQRILQIQSRLMHGRSLSFLELFEKDATRAEIIVTFVALLELIRLERIETAQAGLFGEITITARGGRVMDGEWTG